MKKILVVIVALVFALVSVPALATNLPVFKWATPQAGYTLGASETRIFGPIHLAVLNPPAVDGVIALEIQVVSVAGAADVGINIYVLSDLITPVADTGVVTCTDQPLTTETITIDGTVLTIDTDFDLGSTLTQTLSSMATAIEAAGEGYTAVSDATTVTITNQYTGAYSETFTETLTNCSLDGGGNFSGGVTGHVQMHGPGITDLGAVTASTNTDFTVSPEGVHSIGLNITPGAGYFVEIVEATTTLSDTVVKAGFRIK